MYRSTVTFGKNIFKQRFHSHVMRVIRYKSKKIRFHQNGISVPLMNELFGQFNQKTERMQKCELNFNTNGTKFETKKSSLTNYLPSWVTDKTFGDRNQHIKVYQWKCVKYRLTRIHVKFTQHNGRILVEGRLLRKNPGPNSTWILVE